MTVATTLHATWPTCSAFAPEFGELFFPPNDPVASMMEAFGVFAGAFFMRPLGGVLFGILGDKVR